MNPDFRGCRKSLSFTNESREIRIEIANTKLWKLCMDPNFFLFIVEDWLNLVRVSNMGATGKYISTILKVLWANPCSKGRPTPKLHVPAHIKINEIQAALFESRSGSGV